MSTSRPTAQDRQGDRTGVDLRTVTSKAQVQLEELTRRPVEGVTSVERTDEGWRLTVEVVELARIPASTSVLGAYEVSVDDDGNLVSYARTGRYYRNQAGDAES